ncbi:haloacid dehalogenase superfamily, subfamily IA, variant 1 with third motif having Dx(3-4)D or Dx(3-4)E [Lentzea xinjiangensis]|uniref:Haloacid dehalogenase superfamily, subfamily IA, variant 1 with third motif having Dx(3-4)D or Dx(3-4)E n=1 Tax=Lentzea xinjiangensis TaxID=402600 RepID=A0A1H9QTZ3_9PSEU|nr:HAD family hydrolase [Lentzea xinjiangensis]SER63900.1 haloacid dehalogenase superfamily, subfamily IA, variant 1 with third motif having Dx(3-4)D or Dx(3-4)E [Lentzea xinjiangensis]
MSNTLVLDVDGTLVDTNYHHTVAWLRAFRGIDVTVPAWRVHRAIGMGGDRLVAAVAGDKVEQDHGDELRAAWERHFDEVLDEIQPFEGAHRLVRAATGLGLTVVLASSGKRKHIEHYLKLIDPGDVAWTSSDDVESSKPAPDLIQVALSQVDSTRAVVVGDSVWDCEAAGRAGLPSIGLLTGGVSEDELIDRGASAVYPDLDSLRAELSDLPFADVTESGA